MSLLSPAGCGMKGNLKVGMQDCKWSEGDGKLVIFIARIIVLLSHGKRM